MASGYSSLPSGVSGQHMAKPPTTVSFVKASFPGIYTHIFQKRCYLNAFVSLSRTVYTYRDRRE